MLDSFLSTLVSNNKRSFSPLGLGKRILDSLYLLIPLINAEKAKPWSHTASFFPWVTLGTQRQNTWNKIYGLLSFILSSFFCAWPFHQKLGSSLIYFFIYTRPFDQNIWLSLIYSFFCKRPFDENIWSSFICSFFSGRTFEKKLGSSFIYFIYLHTTVRLK